GVPADYSANVASVLSKIFTNMSFAKQNGMSDTKFAAEGDAINRLFTIALSAKGEKDVTLFDINGVSGKLNMTVAAFVDLISNSEIVSKTLLELSYAPDGSNGYKLLENNTIGNLTAKITDYDKAAVAEYCNKQMGSSYENARKYAPILVIFGDNSIKSFK
ncbi:MAG: hypothetical protein RR057_05810, partial [Clostridia bacterium]